MMIEEIARLLTRSVFPAVLLEMTRRRLAERRRRITR